MTDETSISDKTIRLMLVDDHELTLAGLSMTLKNKQDLELVGMARNGRQAVQMAVELEPDIILMDIRMPDINGIEATRNIKSTLPECKVIILTSAADPAEIEAAIIANVNAICHKDVAVDRLYQAILMVSEGGFWLDPAAADQLLTQSTLATDKLRQDSMDVFNIQNSRKPRLLTQRETEIIQLVAGGLNNKEIAMKLRIRLATVKAHLTNIYHKMGVSDRTQVAIKVLQQGSTYTTPTPAEMVHVN